MSTPSTCRTYVMRSPGSGAGRIDAVVHVAALDWSFGGLEDADFATWRSVLDVNLPGALRMTRACPGGLKERGGSVVFIGTQSAVAAPTQVRQAAYAASKGAPTSAISRRRGSWGRTGSG
ncbi:NAD(P)-dependent dehydrogenase (short-subunit alcohol dehydrogenase family) [Streptomyces phaeoluteigriseus]